MNSADVLLQRQLPTSLYRVAKFMRCKSACTGWSISGGVAPQLASKFPFGCHSLIPARAMLVTQVSADRPHDNDWQIQIQIQIQIHSAL